MCVYSSSICSSSNQSSGHRGHRPHFTRGSVSPICQCPRILHPETRIMFELCYLCITRCHICFFPTIQSSDLLPYAIRSNEHPRTPQYIYISITRQHHSIFAKHTHFYATFSVGFAPSSFAKNICFNESYIHIYIYTIAFASQRHDGI